MVTYRASGEVDKRGNTIKRRRRKLWLLETFGDGGTCPCVHCGLALNYDTLTVDRIEPRGSYNRDNIQPSCGPCNEKRGNNPQYRIGTTYTTASEGWGDEQV